MAGMKKHAYITVAGHLADCSKHQQDRRHLPTLQRPYHRLREVDRKVAPITAIWLHRPHNIVGHHGS